MYCAGLMLPKMIQGFKFRIIDMDNVGGDSIIELNAPEDYYKIAILLRDNERFAIESIWSRTFDEPAVAISAQRLHNIAGTYTGKDDPVAIVRNQGVFPAPEEVLSPFGKAHFVGGDARGSHVMPLMPVALNTAVTGIYCLPLVSCVGFSIDSDGRFSDSTIDMFDNVAWDSVRFRAQEKAMPKCAPRAGQALPCCPTPSWSTAGSAPLSKTSSAGSPSRTARSPLRRPRPL